jgi:hypothetical protein
MPDADPAAPLRIAMWSGPRSVSTALMRAFGNRPDTAVIDEPFYGYYLVRTGLDHPGRDAAIASQPGDWCAVAQALTGPVPGDCRVWYQKHMAHHLLAEVGRGWLDRVANAFLIREPREVLASYAKLRANPTLDDLGLRQQCEIFRRVADRAGQPPPVLDARDLLADPRAALTALCDALGIPFSEAMLSWPPGRRETDGVWAAHWYAAVERSTGFQTYRPRRVELPPALEALADQARPYYAELHAARLTG